MNYKPSVCSLTRKKKRNDSFEMKLKTNSCKHSKWNQHVQTKKKSNWNQNDINTHHGQAYSQGMPQPTLEKNSVLSFV